MNPLEDSDIIDLTDIVAPAELESQTAASFHGTFETDEDSIIELTDMVQPNEAVAQITARDDADNADEDDIIELIDMVEPAQQKAPTAPALHAAADTGDDDIIELTDIVQPLETEVQVAIGNDAGSADEDDIIELIDMVEPAQQKAPTAPALHAAADTGEDDIIELTDIAQPSEFQDQANTAFDNRAIAENNQEISGRLPDKDVYFETQNQSLEDTLSELEAMMDDTFSGEALDLGLEEGAIQENGETENQAPEAPGEGTFDDFPIGIAIAEGQGGSESDEPYDEIGASLTTAQIDAAVERLVLAKFGQTIEQMVAASIEKIVSQEIESIRQSLLEDEDAME